MNKEFLPYEQSLALKELGFDEPCFAIYNLGLSEFETANVGQIRLFSSLFKIDDKQSNTSYVNNKNSSKVTAPLHQQAFKWFRENYEIHSYIERLISGAFIYKIDWFEEDRHNKIVWECKSYSFEESELECLKKLIEIVKNK